MTAPEAAPTIAPGATILVAPAGAGKTHRLVEALVGDLPEIRPRWAVLPDRTQVASLRRRIAAAGGALGVSVGTFGDLFQEILARAGRPVAVTPAPARQRLLRLALRRLEADGRLPYSQPIVRTPGFLEVAGEAIAELKRARVEAEALAQLARALEASAPAGAPEEDRSGEPGAAGPAGAPATSDTVHPAGSNAAALAELARIYAEYEAGLAAIAWTDREGLNRLAIRALSERPDLLVDMPLIAVDGFDSFELAQLAALTALSGAVERLIVTLPGSRSMERAAFRRFARALADLQHALPEAELVELDPAQADLALQRPPGQPSEDAAPPAARRPPALVHLERALFEREAQPFGPGSAIEMIEARSPADEAREALRWLKARQVRDGLALEECALIAPDFDRYRPPLQRAAAEFGLPLRFTRGESLVQAPAIAALLDLLELARANWPRRLVLQAIRSPFFDLSHWGLETGDALALDAASHAGQVVEGLDQWRQALRLLIEADSNAGAELLDEDLPPFAPPAGAEAERLLEALTALAADLTPSGSRTTAGWVEWLENLLDQLGFAERAAAEQPEGNPTAPERERPAFERLRETLRALVLGEVVTGDLKLEYHDFQDELHSAIESAGYRERLSSDPAISVLGLLEARGARYLAVAVLGLSEGLLPAVEREDPFLDEATRSTLGLQPRLGREQPGLFYQAITRADEWLLLTRPYLAEDGEAWEASPFWREVERLLTQPPRRVRLEDARPLQEAGSAGELLFWGVRRGGMPASLLQPHGQRWAELQHGRDVLAARNAQEPMGPFEGELAGSSDALAQRFDADHLWSPSRLETYAACPHMFFASHLLALEPRQPPEPGLDAAQLGSILHEMLETAYATADRPDDPDSVLQALEQVADPILDRAPQQHGFRPTPLWEIERAQYVQALGETIRKLAEHSRDWTPIGLELAFGIGAQPALELDLAPAVRSGRTGALSTPSEDDEDPGPVGTVRLRGLIDRLDRRPDGGLRVIDYKTGRSRLGVTELHQGRRIQLPLYALAAQEALGLGEVVDGFYWAILAAEKGSLRLSNYRPPIAEGAETGPRQAPSEPSEAEAEGSQPPAIAGFGPGAAYATARVHVGRIVNGVRSGQFPPIPPPGGCPDYCPAATWCWRYQAAGWG